MRTNITITKGDYFTLTFLFLKDMSNPINITNYSFIIKIRPSKNSDVVTHSWNLASGKLSKNNSGGVVTWNLTDTDTTSLTPFDPSVVNIWAYDTENTVAYVSDEYGINFVE
jgi:hypothetical protein